MPVVTLTKSNSVTKNVFIDESVPTVVSNQQTAFNVGMNNTPASRVHGLLAFDLGLIPNDAIINSATLVLDALGGYAKTLNFHKVTSDWNEGTNWNTRPTFDSAVSASIVKGGPASKLNIDLKDLVQSWVNGTSVNYGVLIKNANETVFNNVDAYSSTRNPTPANQPQLTIDYTIPSSGKKQVEYVGQSNTYSSSEVSSITPTIPTGAVSGDYLIAHWIIYSEVSTFSLPSGWLLLSNVTGQSWRYVIAYKPMQAAEASPTFQITSAAKYTTIVLYAFRNVKKVLNTSQANAGTVTAYIPPAPINVSVDKSLFVLSNWNATGYTASPPLSYAEKEDFQNARGGFEMSMRYLHKLRTQTASEMTTTLNAASNGVASAIVLEPIVNNPPTLTLTSPADNQTLAEGNTLPVQGSATDADSGNVVTVKYKINSGTTRALTSGVSDGSSPLSFAKTLTYSNKRIWDGSTDVTGVDLAENTNHILTIWSEDDQGGKSAEVTRMFKVIWNRPPAIDGSDTNLGAIGTAPSINYTVTEPESDSFTITELLNGQQIRSFSGVAGQQNTATIDQDRWLRLALGVQHELRIRATDSKGQFADRIYTFTRTETQIQFDLKNPFLCDAKPTRVLVTLDGTFPDGSTVLVEVCNNAYDAVPAYEDATGPSLAGRGYIFTNETKTAADWGINIRITINKGTATEKVILNGFGGAFD